MKKLLAFCALCLFIGKAYGHTQQNTDETEIINISLSHQKYFTANTGYTILYDQYVFIVTVVSINQRQILIHNFPPLNYELGKITVCTSIISTSGFK